METFTCIKRFEGLPMAHRQHTHKGHCSQIHGHSWDFEVEFASSVRDENGFILDFGEMGKIKQMFAYHDHALLISKEDPILALNEFHLLEDLGYLNCVVVPECSCEGLARYFYQKIKAIVYEETKGRAQAVAIRVWEGCNNSTTYRPN